MYRFGIGLFTVGLITGLFAANPSSTNFTLKAYDLGSGGGGSPNSTNYYLNGQAGSQSGAPASSANYGLNPGETSTQVANVPPAPNLSNPSNEYKRLKLVINTGANPTDTLFAIAISGDGFVSTQFVKADTGVGNSLAFTDYQNYTAWGGASGFWINGLQPGTTYQVKVKALQGRSSGSPFGPATAGVATVQPSLTFSVATSLSGTPPFAVAFVGLSAGTVFNADADAVLTMTTNALNGGAIYIKGLNNGLTSGAAGYTIASATADLSSAANGYGAIVTASGQSSGGPITAASPYNNVANNVGVITNSLAIIGSSSLPITNGSLTVRLKAKTDSVIPSSTDYADNLTFIAAILF